MKQIEITFPNGETWRIPAQVVAEDRNDWQAESGDPVNEADSEELIAYLQHIMNWTQVCQAARVCCQGGYDYAVEFDNATFTVKGE